MKKRLVTRVTLDEEGMRLPLVERLQVVDEAPEKTRMMGRKEVYPADLHHHFLSLVDEYALFEELIHRANRFHNPIERLFDYVDRHGSGKELLLSGLFSLVPSYDVSTIMELFGEFCKRFELPNLAPEQTAFLLNAILDAVKTNFERKDEIQALLLSLLQKLHYFDSDNFELSRSIFGIAAEQIKKLNAQDLVRDVWMELSKKVPVHMIHEAARKSGNFSVLTPRLPANCIFYKASNKKQTVFLYRDRSLMDVQLGSDVIPDVGHPPLLFWFEVEKGKVTSHVAALKDRMVSESTKLWKYPFSNVVGNFRCCWTPAKDIIQEISELATFPEQFLAGERNFHGYEEHGGRGYRELLQYMSGKHFDLDLLIETDYTVADILTDDNTW